MNIQQAVSKVIDIESGRTGNIIEWSDSMTAALVLWDGWSGTVWVKRYEMIIVANLIERAVERSKDIFISSYYYNMRRDDLQKAKLCEAYVKACDLISEVMKGK